VQGATSYQIDSKLQAQTCEQAQPAAAAPAEAWLNHLRSLMPDSKDWKNLPDDERRNYPIV